MHIDIPEKVAGKITDWTERCKILISGRACGVCYPSPVKFQRGPDFREKKMNPFKVAVFLMMTFVLLFVADVAEAQYTYPPVWTDVMNQPSTGTILSGNYYEIGNGLLAEELNAQLLSYPSNPLTLSLGVSSLPASGATAPSPCNANNGKINFATTYIESNRGSAIRGVGFLGQFNTPGPLDQPPYSTSNGQYQIVFQPNNNLNQSVFFNENECYGQNGLGMQDGPNANGREYGFFLAANDGSIWAYWGTQENQEVPGTQDQMQLTAANNVLRNQPPIQTNTPYYFEMYPVLGAYGSCSVETYVYDTNFNLIFAAAPPLGAYGGTNILSVDQNFCTDLASDIGYVSANIQPGSLVTAKALPSSSGSTPFNLNIQRIFVGK